MVKLRVVDQVDATGRRANLIDVLPRGLLVENVSVGVL